VPCPQQRRKKKRALMRDEKAIGVDGIGKKEGVHYKIHNWSNLLEMKRDQNVAVLVS
jgi:hypothetical protein